MTNKTKSNPLINFGYAILQFTLAAIGASLVAWLLDSYFQATYTPGLQANQQTENIVLATWAIFFVLLLFIIHRVMKRIRANG